MSVYSISAQLQQKSDRKMSRELFQTSPVPKGPTEKQRLEKEIKDLQVHRDKERIPVSDSIKEMMAFTISQDDPLLDRKNRENPFGRLNSRSLFLTIFSKKSAGIRAFFGCGGK